MKLKLPSAAGMPYGWRHWCPSCEQNHVLPYREKDGWTFDGNMEAPTFTPSFKHTWTEWQGDAATGRRGKRVCHYVLTAGVLFFCDDSTHALRGKHPLPDLPATSAG